MTKDKIDVVDKLPESSRFSSLQVPVGLERKEIVSSICDQIGIVREHHGAAGRIKFPPKMSTSGSNADINGRRKVF